MIYRAKYVLPMDDSVIENGEVLVRDGKIAAVGIGLADAHREEPLRDLGAAALMPGFVNAHSHLAYTAARGAFDALNLWDWIERVSSREFGFGRDFSEQMLAASAALGAAECALSGITCLGDCSYSGEAAASIDAMGLRGVVYLEVFGQSRGENYAEEFELKLDRVRELERAHGDRITFGVSPHTIYTSNAGLLKICAESCANDGLPVAIHLAETLAETEYSVSGTGPIAEWRRRLGYQPMSSGLTPARYLDSVGLLRKGVCLAHCVHLSPEEVSLVASSGAAVAHCPRSNAYLGAGIAPVGRLRDAGAVVGLGTDSAASCMRLDFFEEMRFAMGMARASQQEAGIMTAKEGLEQATVGGAAALGLLDSIGTLEPGKRADMVAVDLSDAMPGEDVWLSVLSRSPSDVLLTTVDGEEVTRGGMLANADTGELRSRLRNCLGG